MHFVERSGDLADSRDRQSGRLVLHFSPEKGPRLSCSQSVLIVEEKKVKATLNAHRESCARRRPANNNTYHGALANQRGRQEQFLGCCFEFRLHRQRLNFRRYRIIFSPFNYTWWRGHRGQLVETAFNETSPTS